MSLQDLKQKIESKASNKAYIQNEIKDLTKEKKKLKIRLIRAEKALELVKDVAIKTQAQLEFHLSEMVSTGLNAVFDDPYDFSVKFELRRGKTECDLFFKKGEELIDPLRFSGLGAADVAAFALRCAAWSMDKQYRNVLICDEPFKHLKGKEENKRVIDLMKTLSDQLNLQIICVNDERADREDIIEGADKVFETTQIAFKQWKKSKVRVL
jgi:DNA repair exonuclease SbcCD ATPase subunit